MNELLIVYYQFVIISLYPLYRICDRVGLEKAWLAVLAIPIVGWILFVASLALKRWKIANNFKFEVE